MIPILVGLGLILVGAATTRWSVSDMPMYIGAAVIAGGVMLTLVSIAMLLIRV
jgi:hypothetical protein